MIFFLETYPIQFCLVVVLYLLSIVSVLIWIKEALNLRTEHRKRKMYSRVTILALVLPTLTLLGSLSLFIGVQHVPCRSDYSTNTDAPLASSVLMISNVYRETSELAAIRARNGVVQWIQQTSTVPATQSTISIYLLNTRETYPSSNPSQYTFQYTFQNSMYSLSTSWVSLTSSVEQDLHVISADIHTGAIQWKRDFRIFEYTDPPTIQFSRFGTHLYLHAGPTLFALDAANGAIQWQNQIGYSNGANTIEAGKVVYVPGTGDNGRAALYALNTQHGGQLWQCKNFGFGAQFSALALYHGVLFANSQKFFPHYYDPIPQFSEPADAVFALSAEDGSVYWRNTSLGE